MLQIETELLMFHSDGLHSMHIRDAFLHPMYTPAGAKMKNIEAFEGTLP